MNRDDALKLIEMAMTPLTQYEIESNSQGYSDRVNKAINIRNDFNTKTVDTYNLLTFDKVIILDTYADNSGGDGNWTSEEYVIFSYEHGYGLVSHTGSSDYTFSSNDYILDLTESHDWELFDSLCLTDDIRDKMKHIIAEMKLLT